MRREDYLAAVYRLSEAGLEARLGLVASELRVKPSTAARVLSKLEREGYVAKRGAAYVLTPKGVEAARKVVRNHRVVERFLTDVLGVDPWEAHELAHELEHVTRFAELVYEYLGAPKRCPHGNPVPSVAPEKAVQLSRVGPGRYVVVRVSEVGGAADWGRKLGVAVGAVIEVLGFEGGEVEVVLSGRKLRLPLHVASLIYVRRVIEGA